MGNLNGFMEQPAEEPTDGFEVIPPQWAKMMITSSETKEAKSNPDNKYINLRFDIIEGPFKGRVIFKMLHVIHTNPKTVGFAQRDLKSICAALVIDIPNDSSALHDQPLFGKISIDPEKDGYPAKNKVDEFKPCAGFDQQAPQTTAPQNAPQGGSEQAKKPWE